MRAEQMAELKTALQKRRRTILEPARRAAAELEALRGADRVAEFEEGAQAEHEEYTLTQVSDVQRRQVAMIDAALARMDTGDYGVCMDCETDIDVRRLKALPFAVLCADCATRRERGLASELQGTNTTL